jgi:hypothetical protein
MGGILVEVPADAERGRRPEAVAAPDCHESVAGALSGLRLEGDHRGTAARRLVPRHLRARRQTGVLVGGELRVEDVMAPNPVLVVGCTPSVVVFIVSADVTGSNLPAPTLVAIEETLEDAFQRPPQSLPYARSVRCAEWTSLHYGKRAIAAWRSRRM